MNDVVPRIQTYLKAMDACGEVNNNLYQMLVDAVETIQKLEVTANNYKKACEALEGNGKHV